MTARDTRIGASYAEKLQALQGAPITEHEAFNRLLGLAVRKAREAKGLEQRELAARLGVSQSALSRLETGRSGLTVWQLFQIATFLDIAAERILRAL